MGSLGSQWTMGPGHSGHWSHCMRTLGSLRSGHCVTGVTADTDWGHCMRTLGSLCQCRRWNHRITVDAGVTEDMVDSHCGHWGHWWHWDYWRRHCGHWPWGHWGAIYSVSEQLRITFEVFCQWAAEDCSPYHTIVIIDHTMFWYSYFLRHTKGVDGLLCVHGV